jgi:hypothetical protein
MGLLGTTLVARVLVQLLQVVTGIGMLLLR